MHPIGAIGGGSVILLQCRTEEGDITDIPFEKRCFCDFLAGLAAEQGEEPGEDGRTNVTIPSVVYYDEENHAPSLQPEDDFPEACSPFGEPPATVRYGRPAPIPPEVSDQ
jgi:hypothetical protein